MKTNLHVTSGWIVATFSLLALFLLSASSHFAKDVKKDTFVKTNVSADPFIAEIIMFGGNFAPRGWAFCDGQLLPISQYNALFSLLGTTYGGDGRTTFALPDLRGRVPLHAGRGTGLAPYRLGQKGGLERVPFSPSIKASSNNAGNIQVVNAALSSTNLQPYMTVHYIIALQGTYPSRN